MTHAVGLWDLAAQDPRQVNEELNPAFNDPTDPIAWLGGICSARRRELYSHHFFAVENDLVNMGHLTQGVIQWPGGILITRDGRLPLILIRAQNSRWDADQPSTAEYRINDKDTGVQRRDLGDFDIDLRFPDDARPLNYYALFMAARRAFKRVFVTQRKDDLMPQGYVCPTDDGVPESVDITFYTALGQPRRLTWLSMRDILLDTLVKLKRQGAMKEVKAVIKRDGQYIATLDIQPT